MNCENCINWKVCKDHYEVYDDKEALELMSEDGAEECDQFHGYCKDCGYAVKREDGDYYDCHCYERVVKDDDYCSHYCIPDKELAGKEDMIKVIIKAPGRDPAVINISNRLDVLQNIVGGYIETVTIASDLCVICDEEGRYKDYVHNCHIVGIEFVGTILIVGISGEDFCDCPLTLQQIKEMQLIKD